MTLGLRGTEEAKRKIAKELKDEGMPAPKIAKITGLSVDEIERLQVLDRA